jgi:ribosome recycling factor
MTPVNQLGTVNVPEPRMVVINVWDKAMVSKVERAIRDSGIGINPVVDGPLIRLPIPELNEERRRELTKVVSKRGEEARVSVRNIRRDAIQDLRDLEKEHLISEDDLKRGQDKMQEQTDHYIELVNEIVKTKDEEIMTV